MDAGLEGRRLWPRGASTVTSGGVDFDLEGREKPRRVKTGLKDSQTHKHTQTLRPSDAHKVGGAIRWHAALRRNAQRAAIKKLMPQEGGSAAKARRVRGPARHFGAKGVRCAVGTVDQVGRKQTQTQLARPGRRGDAALGRERGNGMGGPGERSRL